MKALSTNKTIISLDLGHLNLGPQGAAMVAECMKTNTTIQTLNLEWNNIGNDGLITILNAISENTQSVLSDLDVHRNLIEEEGAVVCSDSSFLF